MACNRFAGRRPCPALPRLTKSCRPASTKMNSSAPPMSKSSSAREPRRKSRTDLVFAKIAPMSMPSSAGTTTCGGQPHDLQLSGWCSPAGAAHAAAATFQQGRFVLKAAGGRASSTIRLWWSGVTCMVATIRQGCATAVPLHPCTTSSARRSRCLMAHSKLGHLASSTSGECIRDGAWGKAHCEATSGASARVGRGLLALNERYSVL